MKKECKISIGIEDLAINIKSCIHKPDLETHLFLNLCLKGNFLPAARSDALNKTVDYDALGQHLAAVIKEFPCTQIEEIRACLLKNIKDFSPLISGGFIESRLSCDTGFIKHRSLL